MSDNRTNLSHRVWLGGILVVLGFLFLLDSLNILGFGDFISTWWPLILIIFGLNRLASRGSVVLGTVVLLLGIIFQFIELGVFPDNVFKYIWPLALILLGLWLVSRAVGFRKSASPGESLDRLNLFALWGGIKKKINSPQFSGGEITALMGGIELNFLEAKLSPGQNELKVTALLGGVGLTVPENWNVVISGTPILGGIEDRTRKTAEPSTPAGTLRINCFTLMGGIEIKN